MKRKLFEGLAQSLGFAAIHGIGYLWWQQEHISHGCGRANYIGKWVCMGIFYFEKDTFQTCNSSIAVRGGMSQKLLCHVICLYLVSIDWLVFWLGFIDCCAENTVYPLVNRRALSHLYCCSHWGGGSLKYFYFRPGWNRVSVDRSMLLAPLKIKDDVQAL